MIAFAKLNNNIRKVANYTAVIVVSSLLAVGVIKRMMILSRSPI
jgi:hypothetical protein